MYFLDDGFYTIIFCICMQLKTICKDLAILPKKCMVLPSKKGFRTPDLSSTQYSIQARTALGLTSSLQAFWRWPSCSICLCHLLCLLPLVRSCPNPAHFQGPSQVPLHIGAFFPSSHQRGDCSIFDSLLPCAGASAVVLVLEEATQSSSTWWRAWTLTSASLGLNSVCMHLLELL